MRALIILGLLLAACAQAAPTIVFEEHFDHDFAQWIGQDEGVIHSNIVADPLRANNKVAHPVEKTYGGDFYTRQTFPSGKYQLEFDYLGRCALDCGGAAGYSKQFPGRHKWMAGTDADYFPIKLVDNGQWHHMLINFGSRYHFHLMFEQWVESRGDTGSVYFDNIRLVKLDD